MPAADVMSKDYHLVLSFILGIHSYNYYCLTSRNSHDINIRSADGPIKLLLGISERRCAMRDKEVIIAGLSLATTIIVAVKEVAIAYIKR